MEEWNLNNGADDDIIDNEDRKKPLSFFKLAKILIFFLIFILLVTLLLTYGEQINVDNLRRVAAKVNYSFNQQLAPDGTLSFANDKNNRIMLYKDGICVLSSDGVRIYDSNGYMLNMHEMSVVNPALDVSPRYILAYGLNSDKLCVTNTYRSVFEEEYENKITHASLGWSSCLAVTTYADNYKNSIIVYDRSFKEIYTLYHSENYIICAEVAPNGNNLAVAGIRPDGADLKSVIMVYDNEQDEPVWTVELQNEIIRKAGYKKNGNLYVLTDKGILFIGADGQIKGKFEFGGGDLIAYDDSDEEYTAFICVNENEGYTLTVVDAEGAAVRKQEFSEEVVSMSLTEASVILLGQQSMTEIFLSSDKTNEIMPLEESYNKVIHNKETVYLIKGNRADIKSR